MNIPTTPTATHTRMRFTVQGFLGFFGFWGFCGRCLPCCCAASAAGRPESLISMFFLLLNLFALRRDLYDNPSRDFIQSIIGPNPICVHSFALHFCKRLPLLNHTPFPARYKPAKRNLTRK